MMSTYNSHCQSAYMSSIYTYVEEGQHQFDELSDADKAHLTALYWRTLPSTNFKEPLDEAEDADIVTSLLINIMTGALSSDEKAETEVLLKEYLVNNAISYCSSMIQEDLDECFDSFPKELLCANGEILTNYADKHGC